MQKTACNLYWCHYPPIALGIDARTATKSRSQDTTSRIEYAMAKNTGPTDGQEKKLPRPNVQVVPSGTPSSAMTEAGVKGILINPLNAGVGPFPPLVSDDQWVAACKRFLQQEAPEQFLVNLLFVLRQYLENPGAWSLPNR
jgi:hypothetical protein